MIIPHSKPYISVFEANAVKEVINSRNLAMGEKVAKFEKKLAILSNRKFAVCVDSGFSALRLALLALNICEGDKVGLPAYSCVALANAILSIGGVPVFIDNAKNSNTINDKENFSELKALIAVHTFGEQVDIKKIKENCDIPIIEDCAHALGTKSYGFFGDLVISSFYATKLIGIGEGGVVLTDSDVYYKKILEYRSYVDQKPNKYKFNNKMTDVEATIGLCQLDMLEEMIQKRQQFAGRYNDSLGFLTQFGIQLPENSSDRIWYRYVIKVPEKEISTFKKHLNNYEIYAEIPVEPWLDSFEGLFSANDSFSCNLSLPLYPGLQDNEQKFIIDTIRKYFE